MDSSRPDRTPEDDSQGGGLFERALPDLIKRAIETGVGKIAEGPESLRSFVSDLKLPKEIANYLLLQIEETKNGLHRAVAKEIRGYLEHNDLSEEIKKALGKVAVEIKTEIRFLPDPAKPRARSKVEARADERPAPDASDDVRGGPRR
jgi:hypothetical protein